MCGIVGYTGPKEVVKVLLDTPGSLVADHHRQRPGPRAGDHGEVRAAQAGGADAHQHFAGGGLGQRELDDFQRTRPGVRPGQAAPCQQCAAKPEHEFGIVSRGA